MQPTAATTWRPAHPVDIFAILGSLQRGRGDPTFRADGERIWRASRTPCGASTLCLHADRSGVQARAWGPGADWTIAGVPALLGALDDPTGFRARHSLVRETQRRHPGWRVPRTGLVLESLIPAVLEQKVTGIEARRAWRSLVMRYGDPAPGPAPAGLRVMPDAATWRRIPSWVWHRAGVDGKRARTILAACAVADRLEAVVDLPAAEGQRRLRTVPGIGPWTAAEVAQRALGDADAVSVGDYHLAAFVGWALLGRPLNDDGLLDLLAPDAPHRYRTVRMVELSGARSPAFGPRQPIRDYRAI